MDAAFAGQLFAIFILTSLLPGAFLAYGLSKNVTWARVLAAFIFIGGPLGQFNIGNYFEGALGAFFAAATWLWLAHFYRLQKDRLD